VVGPLHRLRLRTNLSQPPDQAPKNDGKLLHIPQKYH
jgi:hypothetical protein